MYYMYLGTSHALHVYVRSDQVLHCFALVMPVVDRMYHSGP